MYFSSGGNHVYSSYPPTSPGPLKKSKGTAGTAQYVHVHPVLHSPLAVEGDLGCGERPPRLLGARKVVRVLARLHQAANRRPPTLAPRAGHLPPSLDLARRSPRAERGCAGGDDGGGSAGRGRGGERGGGGRGGSEKKREGGRRDA